MFIFFCLRRNREGAIKRKTLLLFDILPRNLLHDPFVFHYCFVRIQTHVYLYALRRHIRLGYIHIYICVLHSICHTRGIFFVEWKIKLNGFLGSARAKLVHSRVRTTWCPFDYAYYCDANESFFAIPMKTSVETYPSKLILTPEKNVIKLLLYNLAKPTGLYMTYKSLIYTCYNL